MTSVIHQAGMSKQRGKGFLIIILSQGLHQALNNKIRKHITARKVSGYKPIQVNVSFNVKTIKDYSRPSSLYIWLSYKADVQNKTFQ